MFRVRVEGMGGGREGHTHLGWRWRGLTLSANLSCSPVAGERAVHVNRLHFLLRQCHDTHPLCSTFDDDAALRVRRTQRNNAQRFEIGSTGERRPEPTVPSPRSLCLTGATFGAVKPTSTQQNMQHIVWRPRIYSALTLLVLAWSFKI